MPSIQVPSFIHVALVVEILAEHRRVLEAQNKLMHITPEETAENQQKIRFISEIIGDDTDSEGK